MPNKQVSEYTPLLTRTLYEINGTDNIFKTFHQYYSPTQQEIVDAKEMLIMADQARDAGEGVAIVNGKFIGPPMIKAANKILLKQNLIDSKK